MVAMKTSDLILPIRRRASRERRQILDCAHARRRKLFRLLRPGFIFNQGQTGGGLLEIAA